MASEQSMTLGIMQGATEATKEAIRDPIQHYKTSTSNAKEKNKQKTTPPPKTKKPRRCRAKAGHVRLKISR